VEDANTIRLILQGYDTVTKLLLVRKELEELEGGVSTFGDPL